MEWSPGDKFTAEFPDDLEGVRHWREWFPPGDVFEVFDASADSVWADNNYVISPRFMKPVSVSPPTN